MSIDDQVSDEEAIMTTREEVRLARLESAVRHQEEEKIKEVLRSYRTRETIAGLDRAEIVAMTQGDGIMTRSDLRGMHYIAAEKGERVRSGNYGSEAVEAKF